MKKVFLIITCGMSIFFLYGSEQRSIPKRSAITAIQNAVTLWGDFTRYASAVVQFAKRYPDYEMFELKCATCKKQISGTEIDVILFKQQFNNLNDQEAFNALKTCIDNEITIFLNKTCDDLKKWTLDAAYRHNCNCTCGALSWQLVEESSIQSKTNTPEKQENL